MKCECGCRACRLADAGKYGAAKAVLELERELAKVPGGGLDG